MLQARQNRAYCKQSSLTAATAYLNPKALSVYRDKKEGEGEAVHGDHAVEGRCEHKNRHCHFPSIESAGSDLGEGGSCARAAV
ncbi:TPA: hypothetical protein ACH3X2_014058 [Trebouxia sp. C0005]